MLRAHAKELGIDVSVEENAESSEHQQVLKSINCICVRNVKSFSILGLPACTSHQEICSGVS